MGWSESQESSPHLIPHLWELLNIEVQQKPFPPLLLLPALYSLRVGIYHESQSKELSVHGPGLRMCACLTHSKAERQQKVENLDSKVRPSSDLSTL